MPGTRSMFTPASRARSSIGRRILGRWRGPRDRRASRWHPGRRPHVVDREAQALLEGPGRGEAAEADAAEGQPNACRFGFDRVKRRRAMCVRPPGRDAEVSVANERSRGLLGENRFAPVAAEHTALSLSKPGRRKRATSVPTSPSRLARRSASHGAPVWRVTGRNGPTWSITGDQPGMKPRSVVRAFRREPGVARRDASARACAAWPATLRVSGSRGRVRSLPSGPPRRRKDGTWNR